MKSETCLDIDKVYTLLKLVERHYSEITARAVLTSFIWHIRREPLGEDYTTTVAHCFDEALKTCDVMPREEL